MRRLSILERLVAGLCAVALPASPAVAASSARIDLPADAVPAHCAEARGEFEAAFQALGGKPLPEAERVWTQATAETTRARQDWLETRDRLGRTYMAREGEAKAAQDRLAETRQRIDALRARIQSLESQRETTIAQDAVFREQLQQKAERRIVVVVEFAYHAWNAAPGTAFRAVTDRWTGTLVEAALGVRVSEESEVVNGVLVNQRAALAVSGSVTPVGDQVTVGGGFDAATNQVIQQVVQVFSVKPLAGDPLSGTVPDLPAGVQAPNRPRLLSHADQLADFGLAPAAARHGTVARMLTEARAFNTQADARMAEIWQDWQTLRRVQSNESLSAAIAAAAAERDQANAQIPALERAVAAAEAAREEVKTAFQAHARTERIPLPRRLNRSQGTQAGRSLGVLAVDVAVEACEELLKQARERRHQSETTVAFGRLTSETEAQEAQSLRLAQLELLVPGFAWRNGQNELTVKLVAEFALVHDDGTVIEDGLGLTESDWQAVQRALNKLGYDAGAVDGLPGRSRQSNTRLALARWQRAAGRPVVEYGYLTAEGHAALLQAVGELEPEPGEVREFEGIEFVWVPGGSFEMGCGSWAGECYDNEKPVHRVTLDGFWLGKYEVTQAEWKRVMGSDPSYFDERSDDHPVEKVSWDDIQGFLRKLNGGSSGPFRLPSESEWEYACRSGGKAELYCGGSDVDALAWYGFYANPKGNSGEHTNPVGRKRPNGLGLHDMSGNVWEWVQDCWNVSYNGAPNNGNSWTSGQCEYRVLRGGSWDNIPRGVRSAYRDWYSTVHRGNYLGFRVARTF